MPQLTDYYLSPTKRWADSHLYEKSILSPVAPEYSTGESLLGAAYRKLINGKTEPSVDLEKISGLPGRLSDKGDVPNDVWVELLLSFGGLESPRLKRQNLDLPQLMPLVPEISKHACVLGKVRNRWDPGNLILNAIFSGISGDLSEARSLITGFQNALRVSPEDDLFSRFIENEFSKLSDPTHTDELPEVPDYNRGIWRTPNLERLTPAEQFNRDLKNLIKLKGLLTRKQWIVLVEVLLRIGLSSHYLWVCNLNTTIWTLSKDVLENDQVPTVAEIEKRCWENHHDGQHYFSLGETAIPSIKRILRNYMIARFGINVTLYSLEDSGNPLDEPIGISAGTSSPSENIRGYLLKLREHSSEIQAECGQQFEGRTIKKLAARIADNNPRSLDCTSGANNNKYEFFRYALGQLSARDDELKSYDQSYFLYPQFINNTNSPQLFRPGPSALVLLSFCCCKSKAGLPTSMDDFIQYLGNYGVNVPGAELKKGETSRNLEKLGLIVDSPDAGGGRMLVSPFFGAIT